MSDTMIRANSAVEVERLRQTLKEVLTWLREAEEGLWVQESGNGIGQAVQVWLPADGCRWIDEKIERVLDGRDDPDEWYIQPVMEELLT